MAKDTQAVVSATIVDELGIEASAPFYALLDSGQTLAAIMTEVNAFWTALSLCTDGYIKKVKLEIVPAVPTGATTVASVGSRVEQTGLLGFSATGTTKRYSGAIPALSNQTSVFNAGKIVLTGGDPVGALITILTTVATALAWINDHGQEIQAFTDALVSFRKKRRQLQRSSFEV